MGVLVLTEGLGQAQTHESRRGTAFPSLQQGSRKYFNGTFTILLCVLTSFIISTVVVKETYLG